MTQISYSSSSSSSSSTREGKAARKVWTPVEEAEDLDPTFVALGASWRRSLLAENMAPQTLTIYLEAHRRLGVFLARAGLPQQPRRLQREHIEAWVISLFEDGYAAASASVFYRAIHRWFVWLEEEEEITASPTKRMKPPRVPETYKPVLTDAQVTSILTACRGTLFADYRDLALIALLFDTGMRRSEAASIRLDRLNLDEQFVVVEAKGRRDRIIAFGRQTTRTLDRYLRRRAGQDHAQEPWLFIGQRGRITPSGVYQIVVARSQLAGLGEVQIHPHLFRHTYAHLFLEAGGQESDLMAQAGWRSPQMVRRYGAALREKRARESAKRLSPADRMADQGR